MARSVFLYLPLSLIVSLYDITNQRGSAKCSLTCGLSDPANGELSRARYERRLEYFVGLYTQTKV